MIPRVLIARVFGGLGNQLFIYANARALSHRTGAELQLDVRTGFPNDPYKRSLCLHHFNVTYKPAGRLASFEFPLGRIARRGLREFNQRVVRNNYLTEKDYRSVDYSIIHAPIHSPTWIEGYWQSPTYFDDIREILLSELTFRTRLGEQSQEVARSIAGEGPHAVALHARRLRNQLVGEENAKIKSLGLDYYEAAAAEILRRDPEAHFFCFSDDPTWLETHLKIPGKKTFVSHNAGDDRGHEDFWLMTQCKHFIVSNSTFAWWPAWLGESAEKQVVAPSLRFWDCQEILPSGWTVLGN